MKAFISLDLAGLPHLVSREHLHVKGALYSEARKIATDVAMSVADSHGLMVNILVQEVPGYVKLMRGFPRPLSMVAGAKGSEFAIFLGYHAKAGSGRATFDHTYSGATVDRIEINGVEVSETLLNACLLGEWGIPVGMVAGDRVLIDGDVTEHLPWAVGVTMKESLSRYSAVSPGMDEVGEMLREGTVEALKRWKNEKLKPLTTSEPVKVKLRFLNSAFADTAELLPSISRLDGKTVRFEAKNVEEACKVVELLIFASAGVSTIVNR